MIPGTLRLPLLPVKNENYTSSNYAKEFLLMYPRVSGSAFLRLCVFVMRPYFASLFLPDFPSLHFISAVELPDASARCWKP